MRFIRFAAVTAACTVGLASPARADFIPLIPALQFAALGQYSNDQLNFNNGTINGDVGIGSPRQFTMQAGTTLNGDLRFSGNAVNGVDYKLNGGTLNGSITNHDQGVIDALTAINFYSTFLGGEAGTALLIKDDFTVNVSDGILDATGNRVFTATVNGFDSGEAMTVNGNAGDYVVFNIHASANIHGQILLTGGITSDHVLINMWGGSDVNHDGGPTLSVNTNGLATFGIFLDPNGSMSAVNTNIQGRFLGGDTQNLQIVSGADITAPPDVHVNAVPEPSTVALMATGLFGLAGFRSVRRRKA